MKALKMMKDMKKLYIVALTALFTLTACDMDLVPQGSIPDTEALQSVSDYENFNNGLNALMRSVTSGDYIVLSDIQFDDFNAIIGNGNRRMDFYNGQILPSTGEISSIYAGYYYVIAQANFLLQNAVVKLTDTSLTPTNLADLKRYTGQAYFFRAYCYSSLADKFCDSYKNSANRNDEGTGLSLQLVYDPTSDNSKYPGRSSLTATYAQIVKDLKDAITLISDYETASADNDQPQPNSTYVTSAAAKALLARVYLNMGMNEEARDLAVEIIDSMTYPLITNKRAFHDMWFRDDGTEVIWKVSAEMNYHGSASGEAFCNNDQNPDYIPTNDAIYLFDENDVRWYAWFDNDLSENTVAKQKTISNSGGTANEMFLFAKYPGNPILQPTGATGSNFINMAKPLRVGELYLIAAEANFELAVEQQAQDYLGRLCNARAAGVDVATLTGSALKEAIQNERHRELMGEGMRQADLKRWNIGFTRSDAYMGNNMVVVSNFRNQHYEAGDYRLVWPIPQHELDSNPQIKNQQNPGYK